MRNKKKEEEELTFQQNICIVMSIFLISPSRNTDKWIKVSPRAHLFPEANEEKATITRFWCNEKRKHASTKPKTRPCWLTYKGAAFDVLFNSLVACCSESSKYSFHCACSRSWPVDRHGPILVINKPGTAGMIVPRVVENAQRPWRPGKKPGVYDLRDSFKIFCHKF